MCWLTARQKWNAHIDGSAGYACKQAVIELLQQSSCKRNCVCDSHGRQIRHLCFWCQKHRCQCLLHYNAIWARSPSWATAQGWFLLITSQARFIIFGCKTGIFEPKYTSSSKNLKCNFFNGIGEGLDKWILHINAIRQQHTLNILRVCCFSFLYFITVFAARHTCWGGEVFKKCQVF